MSTKRQDKLAAKKLIAAATVLNWMADQSPKKYALSYLFTTSKDLEEIALTLDPEVGIKS